MATTEWPSTLPAPLAASYKVKPEPRFLVSTLSGGPARYKAHNPTAPLIVDLGFEFTYAQFATFRTWYEASLGYGQHAFTISLRTGAGYVPKTARIIGDYSTKATSNQTISVEFSVEVENVFRSSTTYYQWIDGNYQEFGLSGTGVFSTPNVTTINGGDYSAPPVVEDGIIDPGAVISSGPVTKSGTIPLVYGYTAMSGNGNKVAFWYDYGSTVKTYSWNGSAWVEAETLTLAGNSVYNIYGISLNYDGTKMWLTEESDVDVSTGKNYQLVAGVWSEFGLSIDFENFVGVLSGGFGSVSSNGLVAAANLVNVSAAQNGDTIYDWNAGFSRWDVRGNVPIPPDAAANPSYGGYIVNPGALSSSGAYLVSSGYDTTFTEVLWVQAWNGSTWSIRDKIVRPGDIPDGRAWGWDSATRTTKAAISTDGNTIITSTGEQFSPYVLIKYIWNGSSYVEDSRYTEAGSSYFGQDLACDDDCNYVFVAGGSAVTPAWSGLVLTSGVEY